LKAHTDNETNESLGIYARRRGEQENIPAEFESQLQDNICNSAIEKRKRVDYSTLRTEKFSESNIVEDGVI
jgi:hypothetical protein